MRFLQSVAAAWLVMCCAFLPAQAATRVALVIGNGSYQHLNKLNNPPNDARDLADALQRLDFDVDLGVDLTLAEMQQKVSALARRAQTADVALAFFAGHGVQAPDQRDPAATMNYLLPVDADVNDAEDLRYLMTARDVMSGLRRAGGAQARILILDACRNNAIPQRLAKGRAAGVARGLAAEPRTDGMLVVYSTQPGEIAEDGVARNSPFVKSLLGHIAQPGVDIRLVFTDVRADVVKWSRHTQTPETSDSLDGRFMFKPAQGGPAAVAAAPRPQPQPQKQAQTEPPSRPPPTESMLQSFMKWQSQTEHNRPVCSKIS